MIVRIVLFNSIIPLYSFRITNPNIGFARLSVSGFTPYRKKHLSDAVPPAIPLPPHLQCISNCFTLQPLPAKHNWEEAYQQDSETKVFLDYLSINDPIDQSTI